MLVQHPSAIGIKNKVHQDDSIEKKEPYLLRLLDKITEGLNVLGSVLILGLIVLVGLDVAGRNLLGLPVRGVPEIVSLSIVAIVFLQIPQALRKGRMSRTEAMDDFSTAFMPSLGPILRTVFDLISMFLMGVVVWATWPMLVKSVVRGEFIGALGNFTAPTWPIRFAVLVGGTMLFLQFGASIWRRWKGINNDTI